jgi:hypothetical protein
MLFIRNMSTFDRIARFFLGIILIHLGFIDHWLISNMVANISLGLFGLVNVGSSFMAHCPIYRLANLSTFKEKSFN